MQREYYADSIANFRRTSPNEIVGTIVLSSGYADEQTQKAAWLEQVNVLRQVLSPFEGKVYFEYAIPRMGKRIDAVLLIGPVIFVLEFKTGESQFSAYAVDQVWDYALDLKNFHESSYDYYIVPILIATKAHLDSVSEIALSREDKVLSPIKCNVDLLGQVIEGVLEFTEGPAVDPAEWERGRYRPTPTIVEAATALYSGHSVSEISRSDAAAINLTLTANRISEIIRSSKAERQKAICFVTGVPGAGKTLVGLKIATEHNDKSNELYSVFLSGNGPLVAILREALVRDRVAKDPTTTKGDAARAVSEFIQNVHNFRDEGLRDRGAPIEHVALFDEAQRAWDARKTSTFMSQKKNTPDFSQSESEFLISCLDRHQDWAVIVCLVGGGQEIYSGEAGISEWIESLDRSFPHWRIYISSKLVDSEYGAGNVLEKLSSRTHVEEKDELHLSVSMRSFRAENVSLLIKQLLDLNAEDARNTLSDVDERYPIVITRDLVQAKRWLKEQARGSERYGIIVSSRAERLKSHAIFVKSPMNPIHWFLEGKEDVRSSYYLEDVATEFQVQGLELDWTCVTWDADFRHSERGWEHWSFRGDRWQHINQSKLQSYLKNAYRVLLTRARQGMVIVVPPGDDQDPTRKPEFYDPTFNYLQEIGFKTI